MPSIGVFSNPFLVIAMVGSVAIQLSAIALPWSAEVLGLDAMPWSDLPVIILLSLIPVTLVGIKKMITQHDPRGPTPPFVSQNPPRA